jgi:hypothetical protein
MKKTRILLRIGVLAIAFLISPLLSISQINYSIHPMRAYLTFYKNGESYHILNDSIRTSFFKFSDSIFSIKVYVNGKAKKECSCLYRGNEGKEKANVLVFKNGRRFLTKKEITVRKLVLKDKECLDFLPKELLNRK